MNQSKPVHWIEGIISIAVLIMAAVVFMLVSAAVRREPNPHLNYYPQTAVIVDFDRKHDAVTVRTSVGWLYQFYGIEDYEIGDMVSLIMDNMDTENTIFDDVIIDVQYVGTAADYAL